MERPRLTGGAASARARIVELAGDDTAFFAQQAAFPPDANALLERGAAHLHACGPRAVAEFIAEHQREGGDILDRLDRWRQLDVALVRHVLGRWCGGRSFPPAVFEVPR
ncbi:hypothetical protein [Falsiroseomonas sp.]|uniref:hypothetical protein n=1 Tax=Falsiroseomonas sp. TaxID=2870721 RepID=UPI00356AB267